MKKTFKFLGELKRNNDRDWFKQNRARYEDARAEFEDVVAEIIDEVSKFDPAMQWLQPGDCVFRIYRDARFSKNKAPYKTNFGAHLVEGGRKTGKDRAGYYVHIEPGGCFLASGAYMPPASWLSSIRRRIDARADAFKKILKSKAFRRYFGGLQGEQLKTAPRDYPRDHPEIELIRYKTYLAVHPVTDAQAGSDDFPRYAGRAFKAVYPFKEFLNAADV